MEFINPPTLPSATQDPYAEPVSTRGLLTVGEEDVLSSKILIFDDQHAASPFKQELIDAGFQSVSVSNCFDVLRSVVSETAVEMVVFSGDRLKDPEIFEVIALAAKDPAISVLAIAEPGQLEIKSSAVGLGVDDFLARSMDQVELIARARNTLKSKLANRQLAEYSEQLRTDILADPLTNISNRRAFDFQLSRKMIEWQRQRSPVALLMIDIDYFKKVNDVYGHQAGDAVLVQIARTIEGTLREMDLVSRFGGEEFAAIVPIGRSNESTQTAERIRQAIEKEIIRFEGYQMQVTVSIGVAEVMKGDDEELILKRADTALYESKQHGRNQVTFHDGARCVSIRHCGNVRIEPKELAQVNSSSDDFNLCSRNIVVVDDSASITRIIRRYLDTGGFKNVICENDPFQAQAYFQSELPDLLLLDIEMPGLDGLTILKQIRSNERTKDLPVIIVTSHTDSQTKSKALDLGCNDFLHKPIIRSELLARVTNTLLANAHSLYLQNYSARMEQEVKLRTTELIASRREAIQCLAKAAEINDDETGRHIIRVGKYAALIAEQLGFTDAQVIEIEHAAQLHDVGKISLPEEILKKRDRLTEEEFDIVKDHCYRGGSMIRDDQAMEQDSDSAGRCQFLFSNCNTSVMKLAALVAETHHEKWDGSGYPHGLKGDNIPVEGRIVAVCDVFDAVSNPNAYRAAHELDKCFDIIEDGRGSHFDPDIVDAFFARKADVIQVYYDFGYFVSDSVGV